MAFYKLNDNELQTAENFVYSPIVTLKVEDKDLYTYPQDGWYWFDTINEAIEFFAKENKGNRITPLQAKLQLLEIGLLDEVEYMVSKDKRVELYWTNAQYFYRNDSILLGMANALGLSDIQLDNLFTEAGKL